MLAELKVISCCPTRYQRDPRATIKAVDRRAITLPNEYRQHARKIDREYGGVPEGVVGPVDIPHICHFFYTSKIFGE